MQSKWTRRTLGTALVLILAWTARHVGAEEGGGVAEQPAAANPSESPEAKPETKPGEPSSEKAAEKPSEAVPDAKPAPEAKPASEPGAAWAQSMAWRSIGPANMGGRITSVAVSQQDPSTWYAATASGGLLKTVNNGQSFTFMLDKEAAVSIGDIAVAPSNHDVVWVGQGEANPRNSVSWGGGVYKTEDGGKTWSHMGLKETRHVGAIRIHPTNPDIVWVGALGRLWGTNPERGLFMTTDGGKTWSQTLKVDDKTGVIDIAVHPKNPDVLLAATYERQRDGFDTNAPAKKWGPGSGLWKSTDGGKSFRRLTKGLPTCAMGRIGLDWSASEENTVLCVLESERIGETPADSPFLGLSGADADAGARLNRITKDGPSAKAGLKTGDVVIAVGEKRTIKYADFIREVRQHRAGDTIPITVVRGGKETTVEIELGRWPKPRGEGNPDFGRRGPFAAFLGGQRENVQDQQGSEGHELGGIYKSTDGGESWTRINSLNPRPMYFSEIRVDPVDPKRLYVLGIRLWRSQDGGATFKPDGHPGYVHVDHHALWINPRDSRHMILGNDGGIYVTYDRCASYDHLNTVAIGQFYHVGIGPRSSPFVYGGLQDNGSWGGPIAPRDADGPRNDHWFRVGGGDGFRCLVDPDDPDQIYFQSQNGGNGRRNLRTGSRGSIKPRAPRGTRYRWNWQTPYILSHHNSRIYYVAGNHVFRSLQKGDKLKVISPDITHTKRGSATVLAESPSDPDLLYVGTDDGALHVTRDGGATWTDLFAAAPSEAPADPAPTTDASADTTEAPTEDASAKPAEKPGPEAIENLSPRLRRMFERDKNGDQRLDASELPDGWGERWLEAADADKDGFVTIAEARANVAAGGRQPLRQRARRDAEASKGKPLAALVPARRWVSGIEASHHKASRVYLVLDAHRSDDDAAYVFVSEDFGATWTSIVGDLPEEAGTTRVLVEDRTNPDLLYLGTEMGAYVSLDRGARWVPLGKDLPTVAVHAFAQHPTEPLLVAGTHGRSLWTIDLTVLRQLRPAVTKAAWHLFTPPTATRWRRLPRRGAARVFTGAAAPRGAQITYSLAKPAPAGAEIEIRSASGKTLRTLEGPGEAGIHTVSWDLRVMRKTRRGNRLGGAVGAGTYEVIVRIGDETAQTSLAVIIDPEHPDNGWVAAESAALEAEADAEPDEEAAEFLPYSGDE